MTQPKVILHKSYELHCSATVTDSGRFAPVLVIAKQAWPSRPRSIEVPRGGFPNEESAIEAAHLCGVAWVSNFG